MPQPANQNRDLRTSVPGPKSQAMRAREDQHLAPGAQGYPLLAGVAIDHSSGTLVTDVDGNSYLDFIGGIAVAATGHCHPAVVAAIANQAGTLIHASNLYGIEPQRELARRLAPKAGPDFRAFFCNSGAEANEAAIKLARKWGHENGVGQGTIVTAHNSFHGRTLATLAATAQPKYQKGFEPLPSGFKYVAFDDVEALEAALTPDVTAVLLEPIQGEGGVKVPAMGYLRRVRELCDRAGVLLILDEVQTGCGRTGRFFAFEHEGIRPDIVTLAKALGSGVPIGACLARAAVADAFQPGSHGSTFGGNPLSSAAALATLDVIEGERLAERASEVGQHLVLELEALRALDPRIKEIRGRGLLIGIEFADPIAKELVKAMLPLGILGNATSEHVLRLAPPLILTEKQADAYAGALKLALGLAPTLRSGIC
jgi:acetylornithine/N-succinyldiaminopimelate aminotransferase